MEESESLKASEEDCSDKMLIRTEVLYDIMRRHL